MTIPTKQEMVIAGHVLCKIPNGTKGLYQSSPELESKNIFARMCVNQVNRVDEYYVLFLTLVLIRSNC